MDDAEDVFAYAAFEALIQKVEPRLEQQLKSRGVSSPRELPKDEARELLLEAMKQTALEYFPGSDVAKLERGFRAFTDERFTTAHRRVRSSPEPTDAFQPAIGVDAAIVMAGTGLPVAPFSPTDLATPTEYSNDLKTVQHWFTARPNALVTYCSARAEFYSLSTDCVKSLRYKVKFTKEGKPIADLLRRGRVVLPKSTDRFVHFSCALSRRPGDRIPTTNLFDDRDDRGSVMLLAGWVGMNDTIQGAPRNGLAPVPMALVRLATLNPKFAYWLTEPHDAAPMTPH